MPSLRPMALIDLSWYAVILAAIVGILQLIYQGGSGGGGVNVVESHFHLMKKTVPVYLSISIITLTSCKPLPSPNPFKISLLFLVLAIAAALSAAVPYKLWWLPYLSCIRPFFDLLQDSYLFCINMPLDPFWEFCHSTRNATYQFKLSAHQFIQRFLYSIVGTASSAQANSNPEGVMQQNNEA